MSDIEAIKLVFSAIWGGLVCAFGCWVGYWQGRKRPRRDVDDLAKLIEVFEKLEKITPPLPATQELWCAIHEQAQREAERLGVRPPRPRLAAVAANSPKGRGENAPRVP